MHTCFDGLSHEKLNIQNKILGILGKMFKKIDENKSTYVVEAVGTNCSSPIKAI